MHAVGVEVFLMSCFLDECGEEVPHAVDHGFEVVHNMSVWIGQGRLLLSLELLLFDSSLMVCV